MEVKSWEVKEQFCFPQSFGVPKEVKTIKVTPQYFQEEIDEMVHINGIYHITCHVEFEEGEVEHHATSEFTEIEDLDLQGELGYFEYAVPMSVEISKERIQQDTSPSISVENINCKAESDGIEIVWFVNCEYETSRPLKTEVVMTDLIEEEEEQTEVVEVLPFNFTQDEESSEDTMQVQLESEELEEVTVEPLKPTQIVVSAEQQSTNEDDQQDLPKVAIKHNETESSVEGESELQFILDLEDGYTKLSFPSNNVLKQ